MDTKLIEDFEAELAAHSAALETAAALCEAQAARIAELEAKLRELLEWDNFPPSFSARDRALALLEMNAELRDRSESGTPTQDQPS